MLASDAVDSSSTGTLSAIAIMVALPSSPQVGVRRATTREQCVVLSACWRCTQPREGRAIISVCVRLVAPQGMRPSPAGSGASHLRQRILPCTMSQVSIVTILYSASQLGQLKGIGFDWLVVKKEQGCGKWKRTWKQNESGAPRHAPFPPHSPPPIASPGQPIAEQVRHRKAWKHHPLLALCGRQY